MTSVVSVHDINSKNKFLKKSKKTVQIRLGKIRKNKAFLRVAFADDLGGAGELLELRR